MIAPDALRSARSHLSARLRPSRSGQELFQYLDQDSEPRTVDSGDVNDYLRAAARAQLSAKDLRTWAGTLVAYRALRDADAGTSPRGSRAVRESARAAAEVLGNTPAVSHRSYIAPMVVEAYLAGGLAEWRRSGRRHRRAARGTRAEELELIHLLEAPGGSCAGEPGQGDGPGVSPRRRGIAGRRCGGCVPTEARRDVPGRPLMARGA